MFSKLTSHVKSTYKNYLLRVSINLFFYLVPARLVDEKTDEAASVNNFADLHSIDHLADTEVLFYSLFCICWLSHTTQLRKCN